MSEKFNSFAWRKVLTRLAAFGIRLPLDDIIIPLLNKLFLKMSQNYFVTSKCNNGLKVSYRRDAPVL